MPGKKTLPLTQLTAINPLDGRYFERINDLSPYVSEFALIKTRTEVEILYLLALADAGIIRLLTDEEKNLLRKSIQSFSLEDAENVKKEEAITRHDVKAVERFLRKTLQKSSLSDVLEYIHFGLTSEDINNLSYRLMLKRTLTDVLIPTIEQLLNELVSLSQAQKATPMLARTHGQKAVPTTLGKEIAVFAMRLAKELHLLKAHTFTGKLSGAVGNFNAMQFAYPTINWVQFSKTFIHSLQLTPNIVTTQINTYEDIIYALQTLGRCNMILVDFSQDMWRYISDNWFVQAVKTGEVGSSTMPQKVNPIDFENAEGNMLVANALIEGFARKLPVSRLQRDLSDSTTIRNIGTACGYSLLGVRSIQTGMSRVRPNEQQIKAALFADWTILAEGVQTLLRKEGVDDAYSLIATLTKGKSIQEKEWQTWVEQLPISEDIKEKLLTLSPDTYCGLAETITEQAITDIRAMQKK